ncbi:MAG TPA: hypothetical protein VMC41_01395 [Candidatus Nanoarchaeia archaeon]|nr:hypothetical protein [Candidatus Nanoarchaeia archaeon]
MKINKQWHKKNKMLADPSESQRIKWHIAHAKNCACRQLSAKLLAEIKKAGFGEVKMRHKLSIDK